MHCAALESRVLELEAPPQPKRVREGERGGGDAASRLNAFLQSAHAYLRHTTRGERLAIAVAGLECDLEARAAALETVRTRRSRIALSLCDPC